MTAYRENNGLPVLPSIRTSSNREKSCLYFNFDMEATGKWIQLQLVKMQSD